MSIKVLFVSAEVDPFIKTGGLADVAGSLPKDLKALGVDVRIALPRYGAIKEGWEPWIDYPVSLGSRVETALVRQGILDQNSQVPVYFLDNYYYFDRDGIYGFQDDGERYGFFCKAILEFLRHSQWVPDIIHCNDWQCGPIPMILNTFKSKAKEDLLHQIKTLFTIHNLEYQGHFPPDILNFLQLNRKQVFHLEGAEYYGQVNFMKAGIGFGDQISTVSPKYAEEIQTETYGAGLDGLLRNRRDRLKGILNGIDYTYFNPVNDPDLAANYSAESLEQKKINKQWLQQKLNLPVSDKPLAGVITRLVDQKGLDLIIESVDQWINWGVQLIVLGLGDPKIEEAFKSIAVRFPSQIAVRLTYDPVLAKQIYAGADLFLMPSRYEPCGLGQMIALRYGTVPVVRKTGGLADSIENYKNGQGNGFVFEEFNQQAFANCFQQACQLYQYNRESWRQLAVSAMKMDFSWQNSAIKYFNLYQKMLN